MDPGQPPARLAQPVSRAVLSEEVRYHGKGLTVRALESLIDEERTRQNQQVRELQALRARNTEIQRSVIEELARLRQLTQEISGEAPKPGLWAGLRSRLPGQRKEPLVERSVEQLLREQYNLSARRVKEAADFADRLAVAERELYDEIDRLNQRIIESSQNKALAASFLQRLQAFADQSGTPGTPGTPPAADSVEALTRQADRDRSRRLLTEHATQLQLYHTAVERLGQLKDSTRALSETIASLRGDITQYVMAASEKLDLVSGQIRAIGAAADATGTLLEMKRSLDGLSESLNQTTRFVAETQRYFRENLDSLVGNLEVYDDETRASLEINLDMSRAADDARIARLVHSALSEGTALPPTVLDGRPPGNPRRLVSPEAPVSTDGGSTSGSSSDPRSDTTGSSNPLGGSGSSNMHGGSNQSSDTRSDSTSTGGDTRGGSASTDADTRGGTKGGADTGRRGSGR